MLYLYHTIRTHLCVYGLAKIAHQVSSARFRSYDSGDVPPAVQNHRPIDACLLKRQKNGLNKAWMVSL